MCKILSPKGGANNTQFWTPPSSQAVFAPDTEGWDWKKGSFGKGVFSLEESLVSLDSLKSLEDGRILLCFLQSGGSLEWEQQKTNKHKTHKHFSDGPCGTIVPGTNPHPSQGQTGQNGDFTVELNRERPVCPKDGSHFVPGRGPICPRDGSCLSRTPSRRKCLCLLVFFLPDRISRISKFSRKPLENVLFWKDPFSKRPLLPNPRGEAAQAAATNVWGAACCARQRNVFHCYCCSLATACRAPDVSKFRGSVRNTVPRLWLHRVTSCVSVPCLLILVVKKKFTLRALLKTFVDLFFEFAWWFGIEMVGSCGELSTSKILQKFPENSEQNSGQTQDENWKNRRTFVLQLFLGPRSRGQT